MAENEFSNDDEQFGEGKATGEMHELSADEVAARKRRNIAIGLGVLAFVVLVYLTTMLRLAQNSGAVG